MHLTLRDKFIAIQLILKRANCMYMDISCKALFSVYCLKKSYHDIDDSTVLDKSTPGPNDSFTLIIF